MIGIYGIRCILNGLVYVGQSLDIETRVSHHFYKGSKCIKLRNAIQKHGKDAFIVEILELCEESEINNRECHWIANLDSMHPNGYNLRAGGENGGRLSESLKEQLSKSAKNRSPEAQRAIAEANRRPKSSKTLQKISQSGKGRTPWNKGKKMSTEYREKSRQGALKRCQDPNYLNRLQTMNIGREQTAETRKKRVESRKLSAMKRRNNSAQLMLKLED